jgi:radical SAM-linked protein
MADTRNFRLRVKYQKTGRSVYLSHLEVARALGRTIRRAELSFAVTQGFSPHMKISFGSALAVGTGGLSEYFDVYLTKYVSPQSAKLALANVSAEGLKVVDCFYVGPKDAAASVAYPLATYTARLPHAIEELSALPEVITQTRVAKNGKTKTKEYLVADFLIGETILKDTLLEFKLLSKQTGSLRVADFLEQLFAPCPESYPLHITRISQEVY